MGRVTLRLGLSLHPFWSGYELKMHKATSTGQLGTILTFYEITEPTIPSELSGLPISLLKRAIDVLGKTGRAQLIAVSDGEGVRFLSRVSR